MINKIVDTLPEAISDINDGATVMISGFGESGCPTELIHALVDHGASNLTLVNNNAGNGQIGLAALIKSGQVKKIICSFPRTTDNEVFATAYRKKQIELEIVPQGTLAERIRAAGAGIGGFYTQTTVGTDLAKGKQTRHFNNKEYVLEDPLYADFSLIKAEEADRWGNLIYRLASRNFGPIMATAAKTTIVQVRKLVELGSIEPESIITPGIFVSRVIQVESPLNERELIQKNVCYKRQL